MSRFQRTTGSHRRLLIAAAGLVMAALTACTDDEPSRPSVSTPDVDVFVSPSSGNPGTPLRISGSGWPASDEVEILIYVIDPDASFGDVVGSRKYQELGATPTSRQGSFAFESSVPAQLVLESGGTIDVAGGMTLGIAASSRDVDGTSYASETFDVEG